MDTHSMDNNRPDIPFALEPQEDLIVNTRPIFLSFFQFYLPSLYLVGVSVFFLAHRTPVIADAIPVPFVGQVGFDANYWVLVASIIIPAIAYSFIKLNLRYVISALLLIALSLYLRYKILPTSKMLAPEDSLEFWMYHRIELFVFLFFGSVGLLVTEWYRRSHLYVVTNARIYTSAGVLSKKERTLPISKINDISVHKGILGTIFGFGTLIPVTASGIGMGSDFALLAGTVSKRFFGFPTVGLSIGGGHSIQLPKTRTHDALFGIMRPNVVRERIMKVLVNRELRLSEKD